MTNEKVFDALKEVLVSKIKVDEAKVTQEADLFEDLGLDSIDLMTAVMAIEERFGIEVSDKEMEGVTTVSQAVTLLANKAGAAV